MQSQLSKTCKRVCAAQVFSPWTFPTFLPVKEDKKVEKHKAEAKEVERIVSVGYIVLAQEVPPYLQEREEKMKEETLKLRRRTGHDDSYGRSSHYSRSPSPDGQYHRH